MHFDVVLFYACTLHNTFVSDCQRHITSIYYFDGIYPDMSNLNVAKIWCY